MIKFDPQTRRQFILGTGGAFLAVPFLPSILSRTVWSQPLPPRGAFFMFTQRNGWNELRRVTGGNRVRRYDPTQPNAVVHETDLTSFTSDVCRIFPNSILGSNRSYMTIFEGMDDLFRTDHGNSASGAIRGESMDMFAATHPSVVQKVYRGFQPYRPNAVITNQQGSIGRSKSVMRQNGQLVNVAANYDARAIWDNLFGFNPAKKASMVAALNAVWTNARSLLAKMSREDQNVLQIYINQVSQTITRLNNTYQAVGPVPTRPTGVISDLNQLAAFHVDVLALESMRSGGCRIFAVNTQQYMINTPTGPAIYSASAAHSDSHNPNLSANYEDGQRWWARNYPIALVNRLVAQGTINDDLVTAAMDVGHGDLHTSEGMTKFCFGGAGGRLRMGRLLDYQQIGNRLPQEPVQNRGSILTHQFFNFVLQYLGYSPADYTRPGEKGFGRALSAATAQQQSYYTNAYQSADLEPPFVRG